MATAEDAVKQLIAEKGRITFAEYMELALYSDAGGYYRGHGRVVGRDYYTSPTAHPVFGALIALQLEQIWRLLGMPTPFEVIEPGAGDGVLALDILDFASHLEPEFGAALRYMAIDRARPAPADCPASLQWLRSTGFPVQDIVGCVISNELVDALPVHRVSMRRGSLQELYVTLDGGRLVEVAGDPSTPELADRFAQEKVRLEEGWEAEVNLTAARWIQDVGRGLTRGYVITFDYGDLAEGLYTPERSRGTIVSYYRHAPESDPYARIGSRDITAHANFTTLMQAGMQTSLRPIGMLTQGKFLQNLGIDLFMKEMPRRRMGDRERQANRMAQRELIKPEGLGGFRVLLQGKAIPEAPLAAMGKDESFKAGLQKRLKGLPTPLLADRHLDLMAGKYPHLRGEWEGLLT